MSHDRQPVPPLRHPALRARLIDLPHGQRLSLREAGEPGRPLLVFLHGFPQAAFVWDAHLVHFAAQGFHAVAPNLRGYEHSSAPADVASYRAKHLVQDVLALADALSPNQPLHALVAHDWGGAVAWNVANQAPTRLKRLCIINSPPPGSFVRELQTSPAQRAASAYMTTLARPDAAQTLAADDFKTLLGFLTAFGHDSWLTPQLLADHQAVWRLGLFGPCAYYAASPLRPETAHQVQLPEAMLRIEVPTTVIWGEADGALLPQLLDGLEAWMPQLSIHRLPQASHWVLHEEPQAVMALLADAFAR